MNQKNSMRFSKQRQAKGHNWQTGDKVYTSVCRQACAGRLPYSKLFFEKFDLRGPGKQAGGSAAQRADRVVCLGPGPPAGLHP